MGLGGRARGRGWCRQSRRSQEGQEAAVHVWGENVTKMNPPQLSQSTHIIPTDSHTYIGPAPSLELYLLLRVKRTAGSVDTQDVV